MFAKLKAAFGRLTAGGHASAGAPEPVEPAVEYNGYRILAAPFRAEGRFQTAGTIEKDFPDGAKQHRFIRADTHHSRDEAVSFAVSKARQIIDLQGDRIFSE